MAYGASFSRRSLLKALGPMAACLPIANLLKSSIAHASPTVAPLRLILVWSSFHTTEEYWHPRTAAGGFASAGMPFTLNFPGSILAPLAPYQSQFTLFRGLNRTDYANVAFGHQTAGTSFTGAKCAYPSTEGAGATTTQGTSIDQYLCSRMAPTGMLRPMQAAVLNSSGNDQPLSYLGGVPQPSIGNPATLFQTYFGNFMATGQTGPSPQLVRRNAVMQYSQDGLNRLLSRLAGPESQKLQEHLSSLSGLQAQLNATLSTGASCTPPAASSMTVDNSYISSSYDVTKLNADMGNMITLITQALACDITRYAVLRMPEPTYGKENAYFAQMPGSVGTTFNLPATTFHGVTHGTTNSPGVPDDAQAFNERWQITQLATLMNALAAIADPLNPAQKLLDNTVILYMGEHNVQVPTQYAGQVTDCHGWTDTRAFLTGGCGGMFNMNRVIETTPRLTGVLDHAKGAYAGVSHNALLTSIVNAFETRQAQVNPAYAPQILTGYGDYPATPLVL